MALRYYANAPATALASSISNSQTSIVVNSVAGLPIQYPYTLILDRGTATEEAVSVTNAAGTTLTVTRAIDSTTAFSHTIGATVEHGITAQDIREANAHVNASTAVHGLAGAVVGTTDTQTLTNKNLTSGTNTFPTSLATLTGAQTLTNKTFALGSNTFSGTLAQFNTACTDADFASLAGTETLTNKTINADNNTINGFAASSFVVTDGTGKADGAAAQKAIPAGVVVGTTDTQTLTNKTLTAPALTTPTVDAVTLQARTRGFVSATTDASGDLTITHGLGATPTAVIATSGHSTGSLNVVTHTFTSTTFKVRFRLTNTGAAFASSLVNGVSWEAIA